MEGHKQAHPRHAQREQGRPAKGKSRLDYWVLCGGCLVAVAVLVWMGFSHWRDQGVPAALANAQAEPPIRQSVDHLILTEGQRKFLALADKAGSRKPAAEEWVMAHNWLLGRRVPAPDPLAAQRAMVEVVLAQARDLRAPPAVAKELAPAFKMRLDGRSTESLVESINAITAALPDADARAFQKAVRMLMVSNLPINEMVRRGSAPGALTEDAMLGRSRATLNGMTALDAMQAAVALREKLQRQADTQTGPFAPGQPNGPVESLSNFAPAGSSVD